MCLVPMKDKLLVFWSGCIAYPLRKFVLFSRPAPLLLSYHLHAKGDGFDSKNSEICFNCDKRDSSSSFKYLWSI